MNRYLGLVLGLAITLLVAACGDDDDATSAPSDAEVLTAVTAALHQKHDLAPGTLEVTLDRILDGRYASGGAHDVGSGGLWFATLVDGDWRVVWDGNGVIDCPSVDPYPDFPASMIPTCLAADGTIKER